MHFTEWVKLILISFIIGKPGIFVVVLCYVYNMIFLGTLKCLKFKIFIWCLEIASYVMVRVSILDYVNALFLFLFQISTRVLGQFSCCLVFFLTVVFFISFTSSGWKTLWGKSSQIGLMEHGHYWEASTRCPIFAELQQ